MDCSSITSARNKGESNFLSFLFFCKTKVPTRLSSIESQPKKVVVVVVAVVVALTVVVIVVAVVVLV